MSDSEKLEKLVEYFNRARHIVFLTGAGISTESGIPDFRSATGLYNTTMTEDLFSSDSFQEDPSRFYRAFAPLYRQILDAKPNAGHLAIAELETRCGKEVEVVTQNIDLLHTRAGSSSVYEVHGSLATLTCQKCGKRYTIQEFESGPWNGSVFHCECGGVLKPDVTFFGEELPLRAYVDSQRAMWNAKLLVVVGTSMSVYPAAGLPRECAGGVPFVIINKTPTLFDRQCDLIFQGAINDILPTAVKLVPDK